QRDIPLMKLEGVAAEAPTAEDHATESGERRRRGSRTRGPPLKTEAADAPAESSSAQPPRREARPERPRQEERPRHEDRPAPRPHRERTGGDKSSSPFGSDGPVPA